MVIAIVLKKSGPPVTITDEDETAMFASVDEVRELHAKHILGGCSWLAVDLETGSTTRVSTR